MQSNNVIQLRKRSKRDLSDWLSLTSVISLAIGVLSFVVLLVSLPIPFSFPNMMEWIGGVSIFFNTAVTLLAVGIVFLILSIVLNEAAKSL